MLTGKLAPAENDETSGSGEGGAPKEPTSEELFGQFRSMTMGDTGLRSFSELAQGGQDQEDNDEGEAEADEDEDQEVEAEAEPETDGALDDDAEDSDEEEQPRRKTTAKQRINQLTRRAREAERQNQQLQDRLAQIEARLTQDKGSDKSETQGEENERDTSQDAGAELKEPDPEQYEFGEIDPKYARDLAKYESQKAVREYQQQQEQKQQREAAEREAEQLRASYKTLTEKGSAAYDDFTEKVVERANNGGFPLTQEAAVMILDSDVGEHVAYRIANDTDLANKLANMQGAKLAREIGRLEAQYSSDDAKPKKPKAPKAPAPPTKRARGAGGRFETPPETSDFAAFEASVMAKEKRRR